MLVAADVYFKNNLHKKGGKPTNQKKINIYIIIYKTKNQKKTKTKIYGRIHL